MRSGNPTLNTFENPQTWQDFESRAGELAARPRTMTISGTVNAAMILVSLCAAAALGTWMMLAANPAMLFPTMIGGFIAALVVALIISFKPVAAPFASPLYAIAEGAFLGSLSLWAAHLVGTAEGPATGVIFQAVVLTFGILFSLLIVFRAGLVRIGQTFAMCMYAALGGVFLLFIAGFLINMLGGNFPMFYELFGFGKAGYIGIGFSVFLVVLASLFLVWDFQLIEHGVKSGAPKYMEWYGAFALLVTLAWLYFEILRLLIKLRASAE